MENFSQMYKYMLNSAVRTVSAGTLLLLVSVISQMITHLRKNPDPGGRPPSKT